MSLPKAVQHVRCQQRHLARHYVWAASALVLAVGAPSGPALASSSEPTLSEVDLVFVNGTVLTPGGTAGAVAVQTGVIVAVGSEEEVLAYPHSVDSVVDMAGGTLMPGLHDTHIHPLMGGLSLMSCRFEQGSPM